MRYTLYVCADGEPTRNTHPLRVSVLVTDEALAVYTEWANIPYERDGHQSGVFTDWCEDHREHFDCTDKVFDLIVSYLRTAFGDVERLGH